MKLNYLVVETPGYGWNAGWWIEGSSVVIWARRQGCMNKSELRSYLDRHMAPEEGKTKTFRYCYSGDTNWDNAVEFDRPSDAEMGYFGILHKNLSGKG